MSKLYKIITDIKKLEDELEKSWKKAQVGEVRTRQDGKKYKKVSDTGNKNQDWKLVSDTKGKQDGSDKSPKQRGNGTSESKKKLNNKELNEAAKNASETALNNAIKQSGDPLVRKTAHEELNRREQEEKPQEESGQPGVDSETKSSDKKATSASSKNFNNIFFNKTFEKYLGKDILQGENNNFMSDLSKEMGLKNVVKVVNQEEYKKDKGKEIFRGTSKEEFDNLGKEDNRFPFSIFGSGVYFSDSEKGAYGGQVYSAKISEGSKISNFSELVREQMKEFVEQQGKEGVDEKRLLEAWNIYKDIGIYAMAKGVDVIKKEEEGYWLIINKNSLITTKDNETKEKSKKDDKK